MRGVGSLALLPVCAILAACQSPPSHYAPRIYTPPLGSSEIFREATSAAPGHELIVADLLLPPDAVGEAHFHPWEEYLYVIEGSAVLDIEGQEARLLEAGESFVIPRRTIHTPRAGPDGIRAIIVRVHKQGEPERIEASEPPAGQ